MRSLLRFAAVLAVLAALPACDSGTPDDPGESRVSGAWQLVYESGMTYRYALTDDGGDLGGTVDFVYLGSSTGTAPVTGTRDGTHVELNHGGPGASPGIVLHYVLTLSADEQRMTGTGEHSGVAREENVVISRPLQ